MDMSDDLVSKLGKAIAKNLADAKVPVIHESQCNGPEGEFEKSVKAIIVENGKRPVRCSNLLRIVNINGKDTTVEYHCLTDAYRLHFGEPHAKLNEGFAIGEEGRKQALENPKYCGKCPYA